MNEMLGKHILIVEDDTDLRELLVDTFAMEGGRVDAAENGSMAIGMINKNNYDLVLSDMRMPNGDGRYLAQEMLKIEKKKPLLFVWSGYSDIKETEIEDLQICQIFAKPCDIFKMVVSIAERLKK